jgi:hypothetical protein
VYFFTHQAKEGDGKFSRIVIMLLTSNYPILYVLTFSFFYSKSGYENNRSFYLMDSIANRFLDKPS